MPIGRFFCPDLTQSPVELPPEESHHAAMSLRAKPGDEVILFDGAGHEAVARIVRIAKRRVRIEPGPVTRHPFELRHRITLAVAVMKHHRQSYLVEKCTELGAAAIWPIAAERSVVKPGEAATGKWRRRAIDAAKQSDRRYFPHIEPVQSFQQCLGRLRDFGAAVLADTGVERPSFLAFLSARPDHDSVIALVGPEGGWTDAEHAAAVSAGALPVSLGPGVLRVETAAVTVCAAAALLSAGWVPDANPSDTIPRGS